MQSTEQLFPELKRGASLRWFVFQFMDGSSPYGRIGRDPQEAMAARRAGRPVRLWPTTFHIGALDYALEPPNVRALFV
jgi:hypothetical protein